MLWQLWHGLPTLNALLNTSALLCLLFGFAAVRRGQIYRHRAFMVAAFAFSTAFLSSYLIHHFQVPSTPFRQPGWPRWVYFPLLISHIILAVCIPPLALITLWYALRGRFHKHRRIARVSFPIWVYVSISGVMVYLMLYHWPVG